MFQPGCSIEHYDDFITNISQLFHRPELSDLILVIENQEVKVNRSILAARSQYFHALLYNGMKETCLTRIVLPSAELKSFRLLLKFIYSGRIQLSNLNTEEIADLLISARFFCFEKLACDIASYLKLHINKSNVWLLYKVSKSLYLDQLAKACELFFDQNAEIILQQEEFLHLELQELKEMINRDSFFAPEGTILRAICSYYRNNTEGKTQSQCLTLFKELIEPVRLSLLSLGQISTIFAEFKLPIHDPKVDEEQFHHDQVHRQHQHLQHHPHQHMHNHIHQQHIHHQHHQQQPLQTLDHCLCKQEYCSPQDCSLNSSSSNYCGKLGSSLNYSDPQQLIQQQNYDDRYRLVGQTDTFIAQLNLDHQLSETSQVSAMNSNNKRSKRQQSSAPRTSSRKKIKLTSPVLTVASDENKISILHDTSCTKRSSKEVEQLTPNQHNPQQQLISQSDLEKYSNNHDYQRSSPRHFSTLSLVEIIKNDTRQRKESFRGYLIYNKNIATEEYKVEAIRGRHKKGLLDSSERNYNIRTSTNHTMPSHGTREEYIQVAFGRPFIVNNIRMLLLDDGQRSFSYTIDVSVDGRNWTKIIDYSKYWCRSWQHLFFKERVVKHVRIIGKRGQFYGTCNSQMSVVYFDCMYNTMDAQLYSLIDDNNKQLYKMTKKPYRENFIEPKTSVVELANNVALSSSTNGTMRHFRLRAKSNAPLGTSNPTSLTSLSTSNGQMSTGTLPLSVADSPSSSSVSSQQLYLGLPNSTQQSFIEYRTTDFARGSANWTNSGKVTFQLAQPFKIGSLAFRILPVGSSTRSHFSYSVSISNDFDRGPWKMIREVSKTNGKELIVIEFEPQIVTFIEIRSLDYPTLSQFSVKNFECPYLTVRQ